VNKVGALSSDGVLLSLTLKRYYEPLRFPIKLKSISLFAYRICLVLPTALLDLPTCTTNLLLHATPITPEDLPELLIALQTVPVFPFRPKGQHPRWLTRLIQIHLRCGL